MNNLNVFDGPDALKDFFNPGNVSPLILLPPEINSFHGEGVRIYAKVYGAMHIKIVTAWGMLTDARKKGKLKGVHTLVENSSGNTLDALDFLKGFFGIKKLVAVIPGDLAGGKLDAIRLRGIGIVFHYGNGIAIARKLGRQKGWLNLNQYANPANPAAHKKWTGQQIFNQTCGLVSAVTAGLGTTGTGMGVSQCLHEKFGKNGVTINGAICSPGTMIPGVRSAEGLREISLDWRPWFDKTCEVDTREAYLQSRKMFKVGIPAGPSSGFALAAHLKFLQEKSEARKLGEYRRGRNGQIITVVICPDSHLVYLEKALTHLRLGDLVDN